MCLQSRAYDVILNVIYVINLFIESFINEWAIDVQGHGMPCPYVASQKFNFYGIRLANAIRGYFKS